MQIADLDVRKLEDLKKAIKLAQQYATKRVIPDSTTLRELITESIAGWDRKINVDAKREEVIRILRLKTERIYPHGKNHLGLYYKITSGDEACLDDTIAEVMATSPSFLPPIDAPAMA